MKLTKETLKAIIKEEMGNENLQSIRARARHRDIEDLLAKPPIPLTPEQEEVMILFEQLAAKVENMGKSHPDMVPAYVALFHSLKSAGVRVDKIVKFEPPGIRPR